jgi:3D (Asp-Asp-Asp) domain-containing protein
MGFGRKIRMTRGQRVLLLAVAVWLVFYGRFFIPGSIRPPKGTSPTVVEMKTTSYCHCGRCCSYKWFLFIPYQKRGFVDYRIKHVGKTSSGSTVRPGTIAADTSLYPYGTVMYIPGYGYGRVEDTGGAIKGRHIDLYRPNHWWARKWGVKTKKVKVWLPGRAAPWSFNPVALATNVPAVTPSAETPATNTPSSAIIETNGPEQPVTNTIALPVATDSSNHSHLVSQEGS